MEQECVAPPSKRVKHNTLYNKVRKRKHNGGKQFRPRKERLQNRKKILEEQLREANERQHHLAAENAALKK